MLILFIHPGRVKDKGTLDGLDEEELTETLTVIKDLVSKAELVITAQQTVQLPGTTRFISQIRIEPDLETIASGPKDLKVALLGDSGCGKTTLLSVLSDETGTLDDGRGGMRARLLQHRHELLSGSTSSITQRSLVFSTTSTIPLSIPSDPALLQPGLKRQILGSTKTVHLIDSAGKLRFDRSTMAALTSLRRCEGVCLVVEAPPPVLNSNYPAATLSLQSRQLLTLIRGLQLPLLGVIISKIDYTSTESLSVLLEELAEAVGQSLQLFDGSLAEDDSCPVLLCSAVTGDYLDSLRHFFALQADHLRLQSSIEYELLAELPGVQSALVIESVAQVPQIGTVVWGQVALGPLRIGSKLHQFPGSDDSTMHVASIERLKIPVKVAHPGQYVTLALSGGESSALQRGQLLCSINSPVIPQFKPLKRIIAELTVAPAIDACSVSGLLFVGAQRFSAQLDLQSRALRRHKGSSVCLVTLRGAGAGVFLQPGAGFVFVETGKGSRERFIGRVVDYFGR